MSFLDFIKNPDKPLVGGLSIRDLGIGAMSPEMLLLRKLGANDQAKEFAAKLGFGKSKSQKDADKNLEDIKSGYAGLNPPEFDPENPYLSESFEQGPSAYNDIASDPAYRETQLMQLAALRNLAANGGRNGASDANLAAIQQAANANARGQRDAIMQNFAARGMGGSGNELLAQLSSSQNAMNNQAMQDLAVRGQDANNQMSAYQGAADIAGNLDNNDYAKQASRAAANDAIDRFNVGQRTNTSQSNAATLNDAGRYNTGLKQQAYDNEFNKQNAIAGGHTTALGYNNAQSRLGAQQAGNILGGAIQIGTGVAKAAASAGGGASSGGFAEGGKIPGHAVAPGDSPLNDFINIKAAPDEVIVPRTLAQSNDRNAIADFVQHPPERDHNREAVIRALQNLRGR